MREGAQADAIAAFVISHGAIDESRWAYWRTESLRTSGYYWAAVSLALCDRLRDLEEAPVLEAVWSSYDARTGGFGGSPGHDAHLLYTLSALQLLAMLGRPPTARCEARLARTADWIGSLQRADGSFGGDQWGEIDTRFSYCAITSLALLQAMDRIDAAAAARYVIACRNADGGFGAAAGSESHAGSVFVSLGALTILGRLHELPEAEKTAAWLRDRQNPETGALSGRPDKKPDVCYAWWVLASLAMLGRTNDVDRDRVGDWIDSHAQDVAVPEAAPACGFSGHLHHKPDVYHTCFALAGLSLLGRPPAIVPVHPAWCMPTRIIEMLGGRQPEKTS